jgi:hypothetical protein
VVSICHIHPLPCKVHMGESDNYIKHKNLNLQYWLAIEEGTYYWFITHSAWTAEVGTMESLSLESPGAIPLVQEDHTKWRLKVDFPFPLILLMGRNAYFWHVVTQIWYVSYRFTKSFIHKLRILGSFIHEIIPRRHTEYCNNTCLVSCNLGSTWILETSTNNKKLWPKINIISYY